MRAYAAHASAHCELLNNKLLMDGSHQRTYGNNHESANKRSERDRGMGECPTAPQRTAALARRQVITRSGLSRAEKSARRKCAAKLPMCATKCAAKPLIQAVEDVCVADLVCPPGRLGDLRIALGMVAAHFGYGGVRGRNGESSAGQLERPSYPPRTARARLFLRTKSSLEP